MTAIHQNPAQEAVSGHILHDVYSSVWRKLSSAHGKSVPIGVSPAADFVQCLRTLRALICFLLFLPLGLLVSLARSHKQAVARKAPRPHTNACPLPKRASSRRAELRFVHNELLKKYVNFAFAGRTSQAPPYAPHAAAEHPASSPKQAAPSPQETSAPAARNGNPKKFATLSIAVGHIGRQFASAEFWLAVVVGLVTRVSTKIAIAAAFEPTQLLSRSAAGFVACAGAGVVAAIIVHLVRMLYRNSKIPADGVKEKYWSKTLVESAVTGFFGGAIGGCVANASVWIARAGTLAVGITAGATVGVAHAAFKAARTSRDQRTGKMWSRGLLQGLGLGALGGIASILFANLFNVREAIAATVNELRATLLPLGHQQFLVLPDGCANGPCMVPPLGSTQPMQPIAAIQVAIVDQSEPRTVIHDVVRTDDCHHASHTKHVHHAQHHHGHHKHYAHAHKMPSVEVYAMIEPVVIAPPPPPPLAIVPIYWAPQPPPSQPMSYDPCQTGDCAPCAPPPPPPPQYPNQVNMQGPCASPEAYCAERVSFNDRGEATGAVLEPQTVPITEPRFEAQRVSDNSTSGNAVTDWNRNARAMAQNQPVQYPSQDDVDSGNARVSLVMPFNNGGLQPSFS